MDLSILKDLSPEQKETVIKILKDTLKNDKSEELNELLATDYEQLPVDIDTFMTDGQYMGQYTNFGRNLKYRKWPETLRDWFPNPLAPSPYTEIAVTGATRLGKTVNTCYAGAYFLHRLMCLRDPNSYYGQPGATLWFCFYNNTLDSATDTGYGTFQKMLQSSPWFMERGKVFGSKNLTYKPNKDIEFMIGSELQHTLGRNIIWAMADEVSFKGGKNAEVTKSKMWEMYTSILARIMGSYMINGRSAGQIFLVSSKQSEFDFLERYIEKKSAENARKPKSEQRFYRFDYPQWEIHPASEYPSGKTFKIACGNALLANKIIESEEDTPENINDLVMRGYKIVEPPMELYDMAKMDLETFLTDQAGVASTINSKFLHYSLYEQCAMDELPNPFSQEVLKIGLKDDKKIMDYFNPLVLGQDIIHKKLYVHIDTSLSGDRTGISCVAISGYRDQSRLTESGLTETVNELIYRQIFSVAIEAPKGDQISFRKTREFIYYLYRELGWNIQLVSTDGFQSASLRQDLYMAGINENTKDSYISLDKSPTGYETFKQALQEKRIFLIRVPTDSLMISEFTNVERDSLTGKIDHTVDGCFTGDTKIKLVDGRSLSIKELLLEQEYKDNYVYTFNEEKKIIEPKRIKKVFQTKITKDLVKVTLDNGKIITCTPNHKFMLRDGTFEEIQNIKPGTPLMPLYTKYPEGRFKDYRMYYEPIEEQWHFEHRRFCKNIINKRGYIVHHCNYKKHDNRPKNLNCITKGKHIKIHNNQTKDYFIVSKKVKEWHKKNKNNPEYIDMLNRAHEKLRKRNEEIFPKVRQKRREKRIKQIEEIFKVNYYELTPNEKNSYGNKLASINDPILNKRKASYKPETHKNLHKIHYTKCWITNGIENKYVNKTDIIPGGWYRGRIYKVKKEYKNHKVVSIERISKPCRVYDLEIEDNHNFALDVGVFVHNSKDILDSLVGAVYSASKFLKVGDISTLDNYTSFMDVNDDSNQKFVGNSEINKFFNEFSKKPDKTETELQNEKIDKELQTLKKLRNELDDEDKQKSDKELLELYNNNYSYEDNDMLLF